MGAVKLAQTVAASAGLIAEVVVDLTADGFNPAEDGSQVTVTANEEGSIGTAVHGVLTGARDALTAAGHKPPKGLTLRSVKGDAVQGDDGTWSVPVTFYYGDPTKQTKPEYIG